MNWKKLPADIVAGAVNTLLTGWGNDADKVIASIVSDPTLPRQIAELCLNDRYKESTSQSEARVIMGKNFFGIREASKHLSVIPSKRILAFMEEIPFSPATLEKCKDTHVLVAYFPMSYGRMCMATSKATLPRGQRIFHKDNPLTGSTCGSKENIGLPEWHLVKKSCVDNSYGKSLTYQKKIAFVGNCDVQPKPMVLVYATIGHFLTTGEKLFQTEFGRTSKPAGIGESVVVGMFGTQGLVIGKRKNSVCRKDMGIASEVPQSSV